MKSVSLSSLKGGPISKIVTSSSWAFHNSLDIVNSAKIIIRTQSWMVIRHKIYPWQFKPKFNNINLIDQMQTFFQARFQWIIHILYQSNVYSIYDQKFMKISINSSFKLNQYCHTKLHDLLQNPSKSLSNTQQLANQSYGKTKQYGKALNVSSADWIWSMKMSLPIKDRCTPSSLNKAG